MDEVDIEAAERNIRDYLPGDENALELVAEVRRLQHELEGMGYTQADAVTWKAPAEAEVARCIR